MDENTHLLRAALALDPELEIRKPEIEENKIGFPLVRKIVVGYDGDEPEFLEHQTNGQ